MSDNNFNLSELFGHQKKDESFDKVSITVASPGSIHSWSRGEVKNPETINYRTFKPEQGGLFCEKIFGPSKDWECACGKYKRIKNKGVVCDRCGVEVTVSRVRRERMGHIDLAVPIAHIWFYKCLPSKLSLILDKSTKQLERVIYYEDFIVTDPGESHLEYGQTLTEEELGQALDEYGDGFTCGMGAEAIQEILKKLDLSKLVVEIEEAIGKTRSKQVRKKLAKRLKLAQGFAESKTRPEWMILNVLPVIPPELRPLVPLDGGRFATSDLNDLYRRVINRNNRLKNLLLLHTPEVIIRNEKRMLQEAVDALFDNGRHGRAVTGAGNRPLKSLSDMLKGKGGRFRQNLLGKRVDYSGRSVIVIGPDLQLHQCGLPKKMALILFEPFIIRRLKELDYVHIVRSAKRMIERGDPKVWDVLEEVTKGHPVLLNRAPTLHRLSIQAFEPKLIEGEAIRVHPLVCTAYNADFDGDQMAVHVPLSIEAQMEARLLMFAPNNIFSPSSGKPITTPSQDITLGCYFLTCISEKAPKKKEIGNLPLFLDANDVEFAIANNKIKLHQWIRLQNPDRDKKTLTGVGDKSFIVTTPGRVRFNEIWPEGMGFFNQTAGKKQLSDLIWKTFQMTNRQETVVTIDRLKTLGFREAMRSGCSIGITDMIIPKEKPEIIANAHKELEEVGNQFRRGIITEGERYNKIIDIWTNASDKIQNILFENLENLEDQGTPNSLFMMVDSGARGTRLQIKQLSGMRGLMAKPSGEIMERAITSNFREGLSVLEYFISTHGARKGLADTALKTADSGYMTRKLVDVAQDVIVTDKDCGSLGYVEAMPIFEGEDEVVDIKTRIYGRVSAEKITDPVSNEIIIDRNQLIDEKSAFKVQDLGLEKLKIRSVLTCEADRGCCCKCYGLNLATGEDVKLGEAVGIIAAQSIGEPGTQLTMRTFHVGGAAHASFKLPAVVAKHSGKIKYENVHAVRNEEGNYVALNKTGSIVIFNDSDIEVESHNVFIGSIINFADGDEVNEGDQLASWDPYNVPVISEKEGVGKFVDMLPGITITREADEGTDGTGLVVTEHKDDLHPQILIMDKKTNEKVASYSIPAGAHLTVSDGGEIKAGALLAKTPRKVSKTKDITGGLPRVAELFEARKPKDSCEIAKIDGVVKFGGMVRGKRRVIITDEENKLEEDHLIPLNKQILVLEGDFVKKGSQLTEGAFVPQEIMEICGVRALQENLVNEVQEVYRLQGVEINDKHIEIIISQMLRKVRVTEPGDTDFLWDDQVDKVTFNQKNREIVAQGGKAAEAKPILLGTTKASLETESFISAASFQDTTRVLTEAATLGKTDNLTGFKENVIMGHLVPAGTGFNKFRDIYVEEGEAEEGSPLAEYRRRLLEERERGEISADEAKRELAKVEEVKDEDETKPEEKSEQDDGLSSLEKLLQG